MNSFADSGLHPHILNAIQELGFESPTPIQAETLPLLLNSRRDLIALAQTGTGKTAAFGLPVVQQTQVDDRHPQTLILCPTRELCLQISKDINQFAKYLKGIEVVSVYGGASMEKQVKALRRGAQIVVGTPGRVRDLINRKKLFVDRVDRVVLDEADEMLTMGFKEELDDILQNTPAEKQTLLFSATMSKEVLRISKSYMHEPERVSVAAMNKAAENVEHIYYMVHASDRYELLKRLADLHPDIYGIVFCRTRRDTKEIANKLTHDGYNADAIHGDLSQPQRDEVMGRFRKGHLQILVATDVAARGLDVKDLTHVINYHLPDDPEIYIHRSGRTGRAGKSGVSIAIAHTREGRRIREIERKGGIQFRQEDAPSGEEICRAQLFSLIDNVVSTRIDHQQIEPFLEDIYYKLRDLDREEIIKKFVSTEFNRFLHYYRDARDINPKSRQQKDRDLKKRSRDAHFTTLFINLGEREGMDPGRLISMINQGLRSGEAPIGKIDIKKKFSFIDIDQAFAEPLIKALHGHHYNGKRIKVEMTTGRPNAKSVRKDTAPWKKDKKKKGKKPFKGKK